MVTYALFIGAQKLCIVMHSALENRTPYPNQYPRLKDKGFLTYTIVAKMKTVRCVQSRVAILREWGDR